jgi:four helix bundle protein
MKDFKELKVGQKAHSLTIAISASRNFPQDEIYGMTGQLRRAAVSMGANIARRLRAAIRRRIREVSQDCERICR